MVLGSHIEVARLWGMVRGLLGDIVAFGLVGEFPVAGVCLAQDWIKWLLDSSACVISKVLKVVHRIPTHGGLICHPLR